VLGRPITVAALGDVANDICPETQLEDYLRLTQQALADQRSLVVAMSARISNLRQGYAEIARDISEMSEKLNRLTTSADRQS
jgi:hypothetical protein